MTPEDHDALARAVLCESEDHRLCWPEQCPHAAYWHPRVLEAGRTAVEASGRRMAVFCVVRSCCPADGVPRLLGTTRDRWSATGLRNSHYKRIHDGYEARGVASVHGWVPMVDAHDLSGVH